MRWAAAPILAGSLSLPARTRCSNARSLASAVATICAVRAASRRARASDSTTTARVPSSSATSAARHRCWAMSTQEVSSSMAARASAPMRSRRSFVANMWSNPASATASTLATEIRPRSATTQIRPTANRSAKSPKAAAKVVASLVFPRKHPMGDRDPVGGAQQADHYLGTIAAMVPRAPERPGGEPSRGPGRTLAHTDASPFRLWRRRPHPKPGRFDQATEPTSPRA